MKKHQHNHKHHSKCSEIVVCRGPSGIQGPPGPSGAAGFVSNFQILWRPYYSGEPLDYIIPTPGPDGWLEVVDALSGIVGPKTLYFDPSDYILQSPLPVNPFVIPAGIYDMTDVTWTVSTQWAPLLLLSSLPLVVQDGATFLALMTLVGPLFVEYQGTSTPAVVVDVANQRNVVYLALGATIQCSGTQPFWQFTDPSGSGIGGSVTLDTSGALVFNATAVIDAILGALIAVILNNLTTLADGTLSSDPTAIYKIFFEDPTTFSIPFIQAVAQPAVLGSVFLVDMSRRAKTTTQPVPPGVFNDNTQGFKEGDIWIDTSLNQVYICRDDATGAADWGPAL